uniref:Uncharacterized protein n=1 Tax=Anopheles merus TaxID=30066 RepID=A0A182VJV7_ANOME
MASGHFFWAIFYFACLCSASLANNAKVNFREKEKKILDQILGAGKYDARIRPSGINGTDPQCTECVCLCVGINLPRGATDKGTFGAQLDSFYYERRKIKHQALGSAV